MMISLHKAILILILTLPILATAQFSSTMSMASMLTKTAEKYHVEPKILDKASSEIIFTEFVISLDERGTILTTEDIEVLSKFKTSLADAIKSEKTDFLNKAKELYKKGLTNALKITKDFSSEPFEFATNDTLYSIPENPFVSAASLKEKRKKWLKCYILETYMSEMDTMKVIPKMTVEKTAGLQAEVSQKLIERIQKLLDDNEKLEKHIGDCFLSAVCMAYDPHTSFFSPPEKEDFEEMLSADMTTYGLDFFENKDNEIEISSVIPGSTAWNSGEINEGDIILSVKSASAKEKNLGNISLKEAKEIVFSNKIKEAEFKIRKADGQQVSIVLFKTKVSVEENIIDSYILEGSKKIGYISLPSFYFNQETGNGCANDVAKEVIQLQKEGIEGLIFDLRNNGGGSMEEAIKLCGMFVNYGAISIAQYKGVEPQTLKDMNKGSVYDGPLLVLINRASASASELFCAAMQDYNRALIVGSHTYGKATMQQIIPVDAYLYNKPSDVKNSKGYVKLTIGKFYRCTGKTHQKEGVQPDIALPDIYDFIELGERYEPTALTNLPIDKKTYYYPAAALPISELSSKSSARIGNNRQFGELLARYKKYGELKKRGGIPISFEGYKNAIQEFEELEKSEINKEKNTVKIPDYTLSIGKISEVNQKIRTKVIENLEKDIYLHEACNIMNDFIH